MSEDSTARIPQSADEKLDLILTTVLSTTVRVDSIDSRLQKVVDDVAELREGQIVIRTDISQLREGQIENRADILQLHEGQRSLSTEVRALRRDVDHQFGNLYRKLVDIEIEHRDIHDRVTRLELNSTPPNSQT